MIVTKILVEKAKQIMAKTINREIIKGNVEPQIRDLIPMIFVGQVSPRRWMVSWNYQPTYIRNEDTAIIPHPNDFIDTVKAYRVESILEIK